MSETRPAVAEPGIEWVDVDSATAEAWLERRAANRSLSELTAGRYADDMRDGRWYVAADPIRFNLAGELIDGQHRLWAVVLSETTQRMLVARDVDGAAFAVFDSGRRRTFADVLRICGESNVQELSAAVARHWAWTNARAPIQTRPASHPVLLEHLDKHRGLVDAVTLAGPIRKQFRAPSSAFAPVFYELAAQPSLGAFIEDVREGVDLRRHDPALAFRKLLMKRASLPAGAPRQSAVVMMAFLIKTWNGWITGEDMKALSWRRSGSSREAFPPLLDEQMNVLIEAIES